MQEIPEKDYRNILGLAKKYQLRSFSYIDSDDLLQEGCIAYLKELKKYDSTKNDYFFGYAYKRIVGAMLDYIASNSVYGSSTVRNVEPSKHSKITTMPLEVEDKGFNNEDALVDEVERERLFELFQSYLSDMSDLEKEVLKLYFLKNKSMVAICSDVGIGRLKIKRILVTCITYLKKSYGLDIGEKPHFKAISKVYE